MSAGKRRLAVVAASVAQNIGYGGHCWMVLQYLLGLRRLGFDVLLIDRLEPEMLGDADPRPGPARSIELKRLTELLARFQLSDSFAVLDGDGLSLAGAGRGEVIEQARRCAFLLNVMGFLGDREILDAAPRRVFLDIDPGFPQMWQALGLADVLSGHDLFATVGARIGLHGCRVPTCGLDWIHTRPPIVLERWPVRRPPSAPSFAAIGAWRGPFAPVDFEGERYGLRAHEFRAFSDLPVRTGARFEAALDIDAADEPDAVRLRDGGWRLFDPEEVAADPWSYQNFIAAAGAELMVAKGMYVRSRGGWFSDRSACFLASGRPVLALDTGIAEIYPTGTGLVTFDSPETAARGARSILDDYGPHCVAARRLAEEWFDSDIVLGALIGKIEAP